MSMIARHSCTGGREAGENYWTVGRGGGDILLHSSTAALLDERMDLGGGRRQRRCPTTFQWVCNCAQCGKDGEHCRVVLHSSTVALLDERLMSTAGW